MDFLDIKKIHVTNEVICYKSDKKFWDGKSWRLVDQYFKVIEFSQIEIEKLDNYSEVLKKIPISMGKLFFLRLEIVNPELHVWGKKNNISFLWDISFDGAGKEDLCIKDDDSFHYERINSYLFKYCPLFHAKYNLTVGANNPIRSYIFLLPNEESNYYIGLNNKSGKLMIV
ncbi:MAG: hypothetical protein PHX52_01600 [Candidatus Pacebacteria bacterium]|nr:hypothetical protein [Candidatus Paceibacterota bacterium]MDD4453140.1 hypothetical protein [Proteiniphilum sp.]